MFFLVSCSQQGNDTSGSVEETRVSLEEIKTDLKKSTRSIFYNMFLPCEMIYLFQKGGVKYNPQLINPPRKYNSYITNNKKAMNLGVYGVDFGYIKLHNQYEYLKEYAESINRLARELGIPDEHVMNVMKYFKEEKPNNDSLFSLTCQLYEITDSYLNQSERQSTAALIIFGGWIEALYITTNLTPDPLNQELMNRVASQKYSLSSMISLLKMYQDDLLITNYLVVLTKLKAIYDQVEIIYDDKNQIDIDTVNKFISTYNSKISISPDQYLQIRDMIFKIREHIIN